MPANQYCTYTQVQEEFKALTFGTGTAIGTSRVDRFCQESSAYIDGKVGLLYSTPVDSTNSPKSFLILQHICIALVARRIRPILGVEAPVATDSQKTRGEGEIDPEEMLNDIIANKTLLSDATKLSSDGGVTSYTKTNSVPHIFDICKKQW